MNFCLLRFFGAAVLFLLFGLIRIADAENVPPLACLAEGIIWLDYPICGNQGIYFPGFVLLWLC